MLAADLVAGRAYAHRARPQDADCPLDKIILVGPAKAGKAKIRHADGDLDGLEEWVPTRTVMCLWGETPGHPDGIDVHGHADTPTKIQNFSNTL
jgi:hypothetical protein